MAERISPGKVLTALRTLTLLVSDKPFDKALARPYRFGYSDGMTRTELPDWELRRAARVLPFNDRRWITVLHWEDIDGRPEVVGIEVWARHPEGYYDAREIDPAGLRGSDGERVFSLEGQEPVPISGTVLKGLHLPAVINDDRRLLSVSQHAEEVPLAERRPTAPPEAKPRPSRRPLTREHYEAVVAIYRTAFNAGKDPVRAVERRWSVSYPTAARWIGKARNELNLLPKTQPGRADARQKDTQS